MNNTVTTTNTAPVKGRKGAIARLVMAAVVMVLGVLLSVTCFTENAGKGLGFCILQFFVNIAGAALIAVWFWVIMKWCAVVAPRSFRWCAGFWNAWEPITVLGLCIKLMLSAVIAMAPTGAIFQISSGIMIPFALWLGKHGDSFLVVAGFLLVCCALLVLVVSLDICKLRGCKWTVFMKEKLAKR